MTAEIKYLNDKHEVVYIAGGFTPNEACDSTMWLTAIAQQVALRYLSHGYCVISPHQNFGWLKMEDKAPDYYQILQMCYRLIERSDLFVLCPLWEYSQGSTLERTHAEKLGIGIVEFNWLDLFPPIP